MNGVSISKADNMRSQPKCRQRSAIYGSIQRIFFYPAKIDNLKDDNPWPIKQLLKAVFYVLWGKKIYICIF